MDRRLKVLIIDDDMEYLKKIQTDEDFQVMFVRPGMCPLDSVPVSLRDWTYSNIDRLVDGIIAFKPDMICLDHDMGNTKGSDVAYTLRQLKCPAVILGTSNHRAQTIYSRCYVGKILNRDSLPTLQ